VPVEVQAGVGESLPFADASFDAVVCASVLCSVRSVEETLAEIKRVLKPGGRLRLIEHIKSEHLITGALQEVLNPLWRALNQQGCNMNRDPRPALGAAGFAVLERNSFQFFVPDMPPAFEHQVIKAVRR
jgi:ubiquinone/menaquinone biosynthesis C-methylase UbiE